MQSAGEEQQAVPVNGQYRSKSDDQCREMHEERNRTDPNRHVYLGRQRDQAENGHDDECEQTQLSQRRHPRPTALTCSCIQHRSSPKLPRFRGLSQTLLAAIGLRDPGARRGCRMPHRRVVKSVRTVPVAIIRQARSTDAGRASPGAVAQPVRARDS